MRQKMCQIEFPENMQDRMQESMPGRTPQDIPEIMPKSMPNQMPESMPNGMTKINVNMVIENPPVLKYAKIPVRNNKPPPK